MADTGFVVTEYVINGSGGAFITLVGTRLSKAIDIIEDFSANAGLGQGLTYNLPDPANTPGPTYPAGSGITTPPGNWLGPFSVAPQSEPITLGDRFAIHAPYGPSVANGPGVILGIGITGGTPYIQIKSASATGTKIRVTEYS